MEAMATKAGGPPKPRARIELARE